jgi:DNA-binding MarR family transcriptional regulator
LSSEKRQLFGELISEVRRSQNATARFDQAVADALGVGRTEMRCLDFLERTGPATAGQLAAETGLTTGAITAVLDRLERAGLARRAPDPGDRRRVVVEPTEKALGLGPRFYNEHIKQSERVYRRYTEDELALLLAFVREGREFNERQAERLEEATRRQRRRRTS